MQTNTLSGRRGKTTEDRQDKRSRVRAAALIARRARQQQVVAKAPPKAARRLLSSKSKFQNSEIDTDGTAEAWRQDMGQCSTAASNDVHELI